MKMCTKCGTGERLAYSTSWCRDCNNAYSRERRARSGVREKDLETRRQQYHETGWKRRVEKYGITVEDYECMLAMQHNRCDICGSPEPGGRVTLFLVDHDHATGDVRGLLCTPCNQMLGLAQDSVEMLESAIAYLKKADVYRQILKAVPL